MGAIAYLVPFPVVFESGPVMRSSWGNIAWDTFTGFVGVYFATGAFQGFIGRWLGVWEHAALVAAAFVALLPIDPIAICCVSRKPSPSNIWARLPASAMKFPVQLKQFPVL